MVGKNMKRKGCKNGEQKIKGKCEKIITITVYKGLIDEIKGMPKGYIAKIVDLDVKKERVGPYHHYTDGKANWR